MGRHKSRYISIDITVSHRGEESRTFKVTHSSCLESESPFRIYTRIRCGEDCICSQRAVQAVSEGVFSVGVEFECVISSLRCFSICSRHIYVLMLHHRSSCAEHVVAYPVVYSRYYAFIPSSRREVPRNICGDLAFHIRCLQCGACNGYA